MKIDENRRKSTKIDENRRKSMKINENLRKSANMYKRQGKSTKIYENLRKHKKVDENQENLRNLWKSMSLSEVFKGGEGERAVMPQGGLEEASGRPRGGNSAPGCSSLRSILRTRNEVSEALTRRWAVGPPIFCLTERATVRPLQ